MALSPTSEMTTGRTYPPRWGGVLAMSLCSFTLIASEFMPVSLLTPIAADLVVSQGQAGQAIAISGIFAILTSLFIFKLMGGMDRKIFLLIMSAVMVISGIIVSLAPNYFGFMVGRALIGAVVGGFWSISASVVMRLVPESQVPRALALLNGGNALATIIAAPVGSFLGEIIGWRGAFFTVVPIALLVLIWQVASLPSLPARHKRDIWQPFRLLHRPQVVLGMMTIACLFMGQFALFTYIRPFLEQVTKIQVPTLSYILLFIGISGLIGTSLISFLLGLKGLFMSMILLPLCLSVVAMILVLLGSHLVTTVLLLSIWGLIGTALPVCYWTWLARYLGKEAEAGGGLMVAVIQGAITLGASLGGLLFDRGGYQTTFMFAASLLFLSGVFAIFTARLAQPKIK